MTTAAAAAAAAAGLPPGAHPNDLRQRQRQPQLQLQLGRQAGDRHTRLPTPFPCVNPPAALRHCRYCAAPLGQGGEAGGGGQSMVLPVLPGESSGVEARGWCGAMRVLVERTEERPLACLPARPPAVQGDFSCALGAARQNRGSSRHRYLPGLRGPRKPPRQP